MLILKEIQKSYSGRQVLTVPSLQLNRGIYWVQGPNGSGKSTLLKMIAGLIPFKGTIVFNDVDMLNEPVAYRRMISWAEAEPLYPGFLSGQELVSFYEGVRAADPAQTKALTVQFGMQTYLSSRIGTWSSGMVKKLSLVLAFIGQPRLILLDEPLVTLDGESIPVLLDIVSKAHDRGASFLISSHQQLPDGFSKTYRTIRITEQTVIYDPNHAFIA